MSEMKKDELAEDQILMGDEQLDDDPLVAELEAVKAERDELKDRFMRAPRRCGEHPQAWRA